jgi:hypothetical protein
VTDRTGSVSIQYATGGLTARDGQRTQDMDEVVNALWYLLGPKMPQYTGDVMHWAGSITPSAAHKFHPDLEPPGANLWPPSLVARWTASRANYGYMQEIQVHDSQDDEQTIRPLFEEMFANEAYIRAVPRTIVSNSPNRTQSGAPSFFPGDLISVSAGASLDGGFTGAFRVYSYEMVVDTDGVTAVTNLVGSADQE